MIPEDLVNKYLQEYQDTITSSTKQLATIRAQLQQRERDRKMTSLTVVELEPLAPETQVYRSCSKMHFVSDSGSLWRLRRVHSLEYKVWLRD